MRRRRLVIITVIVLLVGYPAYKSGVFARVEVDVKQVCSNGVVVGIREGTVFRPGRTSDPAYTVRDVRIRMGRQEAHIGGGYLDGTGKPQKFIGADLVAGESVVHRYENPFATLDLACSDVNGKNNVKINIFDGTYYVGSNLKFNTSNLL